MNTYTLEEERSSQSDAKPRGTAGSCNAVCKAIVESTSPGIPHPAAIRAVG
jgi:hypothetical protein